MLNKKYENVAGMITEIFEKEFGRFSPEDFIKVVIILRVNKGKAKSDFDKFYKNLTQDEKKDVDFMMSL
jgi:hypothetical protein